MNLRVCLFQVEKPNQFGIIYSREACESIVSQINKGNRYGEPFDENDPNPWTINLHKVSHVINNASIEDGKVMVSVDVLNTPNGSIMKELIRNERVPSFPLSISTTQSREDTITKVELIKINMKFDGSKKKKAK